MIRVAIEKDGAMRSGYVRMSLQDEGMGAMRG